MNSRVKKNEADLFQFVSLRSSVSTGLLSSLLVASVFLEGLIEQDFVSGGSFAELQAEG